MMAAPPIPFTGSVPPDRRNEARLRLLIDTGLLLSSERRLDVIVQAAVDAGLHLCEAEFGVFHYLNLGLDGEPHHLCKHSGLDAVQAATVFPAPQLEHFFPPAPHDHAVVRLADITTHEHERLRATLSGLPATCSFLAAPVRSRSGQLIGALLYGHPKREAFSPETEDLIATIAAQAANAIDNFRLASNLSSEIAIADGARSLQRDTANRLSLALDAAQLGIWVWDSGTDNLELDERATELFGATPGERVTRTALRERIVLPEDRPLTTDRLLQSLESGGQYYAEYRIEDPAGPPRWVASSGIATYAPGSPAVSGMVGTVQDITARKSQEAGLRESEKLAATGRLAATIAHEINNPLEAITNLIYLARTDPGVPEPSRLLLETADSELARVAAIAQQTLGFYRDTTRPVTLDVNALLTNTADLFQRKMRSRSLSCTLDLQPGASIFALQGEMRQAFSNLFVNAIDASSSGSLRVRTRVRSQNGVAGVSVLIADSGSGIPPQVAATLFSPFVTTKQSVGTGLGLWVTRGIIEKQGGTIRFRTRTTSPSGTIFRVFLPARPPA